MYNFITQERGAGKKYFLNRFQIFTNFIKLTGCDNVYDIASLYPTFDNEKASYSESEKQHALLFSIIGDLSNVACGYEDSYTNEKAIKNLSSELFEKLIEACAEMQLNEITMQLLHLRQNVNGIETHLRL
mgnify:FL=1